MCQPIDIPGSHTLRAPVLVSIAEEHSQLVRCERLQIGDREDFGEALTERLGLGCRTLADDGVNNLTNIFVDIVCCDGNVATSRLW